MDATAFAAASARYVRAQKAFRDMGNASSLDDMETAWLDFLTAVQGVYNKLDGGSKGTPSEGWFGKKKGERRSDPLLQYVHQARHADEHGIEPVTRRTEQSLGVYGRGRYLFNMGPHTGGKLHVQTLEGEPARVAFTPAEVKLVPVENRKQWYQPPGEHLGTPIPNPSVPICARLVLSYVGTMLAEAKELVKR